MGIDRCPDEAIRHKGQAFEQSVMNAGRFIFCRSPAIRSNIEAEIFERPLDCAPARFETSKPFVLERGPAEVEDLDLGIRQLLDGIPHDQIVGSGVLISLVRSAKFINGISSQMEENRRCDRTGAAAGESDEAEAGLDDVLMNVAEKGERLGREAMPAPRANMEPIKVPDTFLGDAQLEAQPALFRLANRAPNRA